MKLANRLIETADRADFNFKNKDFTKERIAGETVALSLRGEFVTAGHEPQEYFLLLDEFCKHVSEKFEGCVTVEDLLNLEI